MEASDAFEPQLIVLGVDKQLPGPTIIPPYAEVEFRGRFGAHAAYNLHVLPINPGDYGGQAPRLTLVRAFLYPPSAPDRSGQIVWGGGGPACEDLEHRPRGFGLPREGGVAILHPGLPVGSAIGVVVRNNACGSTEAAISVAYTSLGGSGGSQG